jgi:hypothetical protein
LVFPGRRNKLLSNMTMKMVLHRMNIQNATVHGFRSSFRDWAGNVSNFPREVVETALALVISDKAEQTRLGHGALAGFGLMRLRPTLAENRGPPCHTMERDLE